MPIQLKIEVTHDEDYQHFHNKGGVGKTTYMYHVAHLLSRRNLTVLMVDCDSQCNLTSYTMNDAAIRKEGRRQ
jgi:cellulose biosynthesis protein BcsQ